MPPPEPIPDLLKAANDASSRGFGLWVSFLSVGTYLAVAIATTTHVQLVLEAPVKLPLLGVDLPMYAFYLVAPPLFLLLHLYVLMQLYLLTRAVRQFDVKMCAATMSQTEREEVRTQLDSFVLTQLLLGRPDYLLPRLFLGSTVWLTVLAGPVALLLLFHLRFLPYHSVYVTWDHRLVLALDLGMVWLVWPWIILGEGQVSRRGARSLFLAATGTLLMLFVVFVATVPDESVERWQPSWLRWPTWWLFESGLQEDSGNVTSFLSRSIFVKDASLTGLDNHQLERVTRTVSLRDRDLRFAILARSDLRRADLSNAQFQGATLYYMQLQDATLSYANLAGAKLLSTDLSGAKLDNANLTGADLTGAELHSANLAVAILTGTNFSGVDLSGADLSSSDLTGAQLGDANLADATLSGAKLNSAYLLNTNLADAKLRNADLTGANLTCADLSGANLSGATLAATDLNVTDLSKADLTGVKELKQEQSDKACGADAKLPTGLTIKRCAPDRETVCRELRVQVQVQAQAKAQGH